MTFAEKEELINLIIEYGSIKWDRGVAMASNDIEGIRDTDEKSTEAFNKITKLLYARKV